MEHLLGMEAVHGVDFEEPTARDVHSQPGLSVTRDVHSQPGLPVTRDVHSQPGLPVTRDVHSQPGLSVTRDVHSQPGLPVTRDVHSQPGLPVTRDVHSQPGLSVTRDVHSQPGLSVTRDVHSQPGLSVTRDVHSQPGLSVTRDVHSQPGLSVTRDVHSQPGLSVTRDVHSQPGLPVTRDVHSQPGLPTDREDIKHLALSRRTAVNNLVGTIDEQADVPLQTVWCLSVAGHCCNNESGMGGLNGHAHQLHVVTHDDLCCHVSTDLPHTHSSTTTTSNRLVPAQEGKVEPSTVDGLSTRPWSNGCQCPFSDSLLCDVIKLASYPEPAQTQISASTEGTVRYVDKQPQITYLDSSIVADTVNETVAQPTGHHRHHQEMNSQCSNPHCPHHQENNNRYSKDTCLWSTYKRLSTAGCEGHTTDYMEIPAEYLSNGWIQSEDNDPLLQPRDMVSAPPMKDRCQYHVFFSHCPQDRQWVEQVVEHLQSPPYDYVCTYTSLHEDTVLGQLQQSVLSAAMLSQRLVLVLSTNYVRGTWPSFEKTLKQLSLMNLQNQKVLAVWLEDCDIPESMDNLDFINACAPDFFQMFTTRLQSSRRLYCSGSVGSDLSQPERDMSSSNLMNGTILAVGRLQVRLGWNSYLLPVDGSHLDTVPSLLAHGIGMEKAEFTEIVSQVSAVVDSCNKLPWILSAQPLAVLLLAVLLWLPAFIAVLVIHVDDNSGIALPVRLTVFLLPLGLVAGGYLIKWRRCYWMTKVVRLLVQNCVDVNQTFYFQGRPVFVTAAHLRANLFSIYFVYFDATDCVRNVDLLLCTCMENDWEKLHKLITFYSRDENYLSRMSLSERLTVMMSAPYLVKLVKQTLPKPQQPRHVARLLCLCQFTEECLSRFAHGLDREDVPGLAELFVRHMPGRVSGSAVRRVQEELFHANHGLVH